MSTNARHIKVASKKWIRNTEEIAWCNNCPVGVPRVERIPQYWCCTLWELLLQILLLCMFLARPSTPTQLSLVPQKPKLLRVCPTLSGHRAHSLLRGHTSAFFRRHYRCTFFGILRGMQIVRFLAISVTTPCRR
jgi:hypothetical protein